LVLVLLCTSTGVNSAAINDLNVIRGAAGLPMLTHSSQLAEAAQAHAQYLERYTLPGKPPRVSAHEEQDNLPGFTGHLAPERAQYFGYPHSQVLENVSLGNESQEQSISSLMSAIYHRFAFLNMEIDEIGFAQAGLGYVYNMGRKDLSLVCEEKTESAQIQAVHNCLGQKVKASAFQDMCATLPEAAHFTKPFPNRCSNGAMLNSEFMQKVCKTPPKGAILKGAGRFYNACGDGRKISASWFDRMCQSSRESVIYQHSGSSYEICSPPVRVHADWYQAYCANLAAASVDTDSGTYYSMCSNNFQMKSEYFDALNSKILLNRPDAVFWPADGISNIQPVFYDEEPHPTPDLALTGYPISIEFNSQVIDTVSVMGFGLELEDASIQGKWTPITQIRQIDESSDINGHFTSHQFAWFPLQRLKWGAHYRYHIDVLLDGAFRRFTAAFYTTQLAAPVYAVGGEINQLTVAENHFILYREPDVHDPSPFKDVGLKYRDRPFVEIEVIDTNTIEINAGGSSCAPVVLNTRLNDEIYIRFCGSN
jgi:hypothetical protein